MDDTKNDDWLDRWHNDPEFRAELEKEIQEFAAQHPDPIPVVSDNEIPF